MNIFALLKVTKDLTNSEKAIVEFILKHPQQDVYKRQGLDEILS